MPTTILSETQVSVSGRRQIPGQQASRAGPTLGSAVDSRARFDPGISRQPLAAGLPQPEEADTDTDACAAPPPAAPAGGGETGGEAGVGGEGCAAKG